jgi:hypothetical protein
MTGQQFIALALSFPAVQQKPHFDRKGFAVPGHRMFATWLESDNTANIFLRPEEQSVFCKMDPDHIFPVPNKWGEKGATTFELNQVSTAFVQEALLSAFNDTLKTKKK